MTTPDPIQAQVEERFACLCEVQMLVHVLCADGVKQFRMQCQRCGKDGKNLGHTTLTTKDRLEAPEIDRELPERWSRARREFRQRLTVNPDDRPVNDWWPKYRDYIQSERWRERRAALLARTKQQCAAGLPGCTGTCEEVHHVSYRHLGCEPLWELRPVCRHCHSLITRMDRGLVDPMEIRL